MAGIRTGKNIKPIGVMGLNIIKLKMTALIAPEAPKLRYQKSFLCLAMVGRSLKMRLPI